MNVKPEDVFARYKRLFEQMEETAGVDSTAALVDKFLAVEAENFALFNLVNELNNEVETKRDSIADVNAQIQRFTAETDAMDKKRSAALHELEADLLAAQAKHAEYSKQATAADTELTELVSGIGDVFQHVNADNSSIVSLLGEKSLTRGNVMQYLGLIEQRANELLRQQALLTAAEVQKWEDDAEKLMQTRALAGESVDFDPASSLGPKPVLAGLLGTGPKPKLSPAAIVPPSTGGDDGGEDEDEDGGDEELRPLTTQELKTRALLTMTKRTGVVAAVEEAAEPDEAEAVAI